MPATLPSDKRKLSPCSRPAKRRRPTTYPSNDLISRWMHQPWKGMLSGSASAGGELILGRRKSALFYKSPLSERQQAASSDFCKTVLAEFRRPRSQPPTKPQTRQHPLPRRPVRPSAQKRRHPHFSVSPPESYTHFLYISP